jgi:hypothetical protein
VRRGDDGFAMSSPLALASAAAVALAGVAFLFTDREEAVSERAAVVSAPVTVQEPVTLKATKKAKPRVDRSDIYVDVYNNSNVSGLAGRTADRIAGAGWQVVGSDNWYGTIPSTTIYYPEKFQDAAKLLSKDLGIERVKPAVDPMAMDRLTLILTSDFS